MLDSQQCLCDYQDVTEFCTALETLFRVFMKNRIYIKHFRLSNATDKKTIYYSLLEKCYIDTNIVVVPFEYA